MLKQCEKHYLMWKTLFTIKIYIDKICWTLKYNITMIKEIKNFQLKPVSLAVILLTSANFNQALAYTNGNAGTTSNINK